METPRRFKPMQSMLGTPQVGDSPSSNDTMYQSVSSLMPSVQMDYSLIETKQDYFKLCVSANIDVYDTDDHSVVFVCGDVLEQLQLEAGTLAHLKLGSSSVDQFRIVMVQTAAVCECNRVMFTPLLYFNLCQDQDTVAMVTKHRQNVILQVSINLSVWEKHKTTIIIVAFRIIE